MNTITQSKIREFLALPVGALPSARFADEEAAWAHDPWVVLRDSARTGESVAFLCGTAIVLHADRPEWQREVVE